MKRKQCQLTPTGNEHLQKLVSLAFPEKVNKTELSARSGVKSRGTIGDILAGKQQPRHAETFERIFEALYELAIENGHFARDYRFSPDLHLSEVSTNKTKGESTQCVLVEDFPTTTDIPEQASTEQQTVDLLWGLNGRAQKAYFDEHWINCDRAAIISIRAKGIDTQKWLVKRFARKVPRFSTARPFPIEVRSHEMRWNFDAFWDELARPLGVAAEPDAVIHKLCDCYQTQSVVIALYGLDCERRFQRQRQRVMQEFWEPLYQQICELPSRSRRSRLVLFLTGDVTEGQTSEAPVSHPSELTHSLRLPELRKISQRDVELWMNQDEVYDTLCDLRQGLDIDALLENDLPNWQDEPGEVLQEIQALCGNFDFRSHWELRAG